MSTQIGTFLNQWQTLIGAMIGAAIPVFFYFLTKWYERYAQHKEDILLLEKTLVQQINNILDVEDAIKKFLSKRLDFLIQSIDKDTAASKYSANLAFYPLFAINSLTENIYKIKVESGYIHNKLSHLFRISQDIKLSIEDSRRQFENTLQRNDVIAFNKLNSPEIQNNVHKENIKNFKEMVNDNLLNKNIPIFLKQLIHTTAALRVMADLGLYGWKRKFQSRSFRYFRTYKEFREYKLHAIERIESYLEPKILDLDREVELLKNDSSNS